MKTASNEKGITRVKILFALVIPFLFVAAHTLIHTGIASFPSFPPATSDEKLLFGLLLGTPLSLLVLPQKRSGLLAWRIAMVLLVALTFWTMFAARVPLLLYLAFVGSFSALFLVADRSGRSLFATPPGGVSRKSLASFGLYLLLLGLTSAALLFLGSSLKLALLSLSAIVPGVLLLMAAPFRQGASSSGALIGVRALTALVLFTTSGLLLAGWRFAQVAPLALLLVGFSWLLYFSIPRQRILALVLAVTLLGLALGTTYYEKQAPKESTEEYDPYSW